VYRGASGPPSCCASIAWSTTRQMATSWSPAAQGVGVRGVVGGWWGGGGGVGGGERVAVAAAKRGRALARAQRGRVLGPRSWAGGRRRRSSRPMIASLRRCCLTAAGPLSGPLPHHEASCRAAQPAAATHRNALAAPPPPAPSTQAHLQRSAAGGAPRAAGIRMRTLPRRRVGPAEAGRALQQAARPCRRHTPHPAQHSPPASTGSPLQLLSCQPPPRSSASLSTSRPLRLPSCTTNGACCCWRICAQQAAAAAAALSHHACCPPLPGATAPLRTARCCLLRLPASDLGAAGGWGLGAGPGGQPCSPAAATPAAPPAASLSCWRGSACPRTGLRRWGVRGRRALAGGWGLGGGAQVQQLTACGQQHWTAALSCWWLGPRRRAEVGRPGAHPFTHPARSACLA
jgi:hypothetical protein